MRLILTLKRFRSSLSVFNVNIDQVNPCYDDKDNNNDNNDDISHDKDADRIDFTMKLFIL